MGYRARILWKQLDDRDLADGLAILSHIHSQIQDKTIRLASSSEGLELKINGKKTELINMNTSLNIPFLISGEFTNPPGGGVFLVYLESMINKHRDTNQSITTRIGKARQVFITLLKKIWAAKGIRFKTGFSTPMSSHVQWMRDMANNKDHSAEDHDIYQPLSEAHHLQKPKTRGKRDRHHAVVQLIQRGWIGHTLRKPVSSTTRPPRTHSQKEEERPDLATAGG